MSALSINNKSVWNSEKIESYLASSIIPMRLACQDEDGFPLVCSLWFFQEGNNLWCATHENAKITKLLAENPKCAFEIAPNEPPYKGVRGKGVATLLRAEAEQTLKALTSRYLDEKNAALASWLLGRSDHEFAIRIKISSLTTWDYSGRMR